MANNNNANKALKIGLVIDDSLDKPDGVQQYVKTLGRWLTDQGHTVHYLTSTTQDIGIPNVHSLSKKISTKFNGNSGGTPLPGSAAAIRKLLNDVQFDVLHVQTPYSPFLAGRIINRAHQRTAVIATFHIFPDRKIVEIATRLLGLWVHRQIKRFDALMSVSTAAQQFMKRSFRVDSHIIPNMIDVPRFLTPITASTSDTAEIVFLGRLVERKGCQQLLEAIKYMVDNDLAKQPFHVTIGGKGILRDSLEKYAQTAQLEKFVTFMGFVAEEDKVDFLHKADIAVFPSLGGESFGISLLEAMAASNGTVLAGDNDGYRTVMEPMEDQLFDPRDVKEFAELLALHLNDNNLRHKAGIEQRRYVQQFDTEVVGSKILSVYTAALHDRS